MTEQKPNEEEKKHTSYTTTTNTYSTPVEPVKTSPQKNT